MLNNDRLHKDHDFAMKIWMLVNLELFSQEYFDNQCDSIKESDNKITFQYFIYIQAIR